MQGTCSVQIVVVLMHLSEEIVQALPKRMFIEKTQNTVMCQTTSFEKMLCTWFSSHYVFNLEYCKQVHFIPMCMYVYV